VQKSHKIFQSKPNKNTKQKIKYKSEQSAKKTFGAQPMRHSRSRSIRQQELSPQTRLFALAQLQLQSANDRPRHRTHTIPQKLQCHKRH